MAGEGVLDYHRAATPFAEFELTKWVDVLDERRAWLAEQGIAFLVVVAPDKHSIYPEYLSDDVVVYTGDTRLDQLASPLTSRSEVEFLDLRPALRAASSPNRLFHRTDTHWNLLGSWYGAREIIDRLGGEFTHDALGASPGPIQRVDSIACDLARILGLRLDRQETWIAPQNVPAALAGPDGNQVTWKVVDVPFRFEAVVATRGLATKAVVFGDSLSEALIPWISPCFGRVVWRRTYWFDRDLVLRERPDLVIQQLVERKLWVLDPEIEAPTSK